MPLPVSKFNRSNAIIATEADLRVLKDVDLGKPIPTLIMDGITSTQDFMMVRNPTGEQFPDRNFVVTIHDENIFVSSRNMDSFEGLVRGVDGTTPIAHADGSQVHGWIVASHHNQLAAEILAMQNNMMHTFQLGPNLISNNDFETGEHQWNLVTGGGPPSTRIQGSARRGSWHIQGATGGRDGGLTMDPLFYLNVLPGVEYVLGFDMKVNDNSQDVWLGIGEYEITATVWNWNPFISMSNGLGDTRASNIGLQSNQWKRMFGRVVLRHDTYYVRVHLRGNRAINSPVKPNGWTAFDGIYFGELIHPATEYGMAAFVEPRR